jgi:hypothetical protein
MTALARAVGPLAGSSISHISAWNTMSIAATIGGCLAVLGLIGVHFSPLRQLDRVNYAVHRDHTHLSDQLL